MYIYSEHQTKEITNGIEENGVCKPENESTTDQELLGIPEFNQQNQVGKIKLCVILNHVRNERFDYERILPFTYLYDYRSIDYLTDLYQ